MELGVILRHVVAELFDYADWTSFTHFFAVFSYIYSRPEAAVDVKFDRLLSQSIIQKAAVKFDDPWLNCSGGIFDPKPSETALSTAF